jgi:hypothetical protein
MLVEQNFQRVHRGGKLAPGLSRHHIRRRIGKLAQHPVATLAERLFQIRRTQAQQQCVDLTHQDFCLGNFPNRHRLSDRACRDTVQLLALEDTASHGTRLINRATAFGVRRARLEDAILFPFAFHLQAKRRKRLRRIAGLQLHEVKQHTIATHPAWGTEPRGCGRKIRRGHAERTRRACIAPHQACHGKQWNVLPLPQISLHPA